MVRELTAPQFLPDGGPSRHGRHLVSGGGGREVTPGAADVVHFVVAAALTYALGFERDLRGSPAGDRVFSLIGVGAGIVGVLAVHGAPTALQGALTGIGFIGAGLVFRQELGRLERFRGLTTAAAIFAAAAIGAAAGEGRRCWPPLPRSSRCWCLSCVISRC